MEVPIEPAQQKAPESGWGALLGVEIIVVLLALGAVYFFVQENARFHTPPVQENINA